MDMEQIMKQAQKFQEKLGDIQSDLADQTVSSSVGGGMVSAEVNGKHELLSLKIEKEVINSEDPEMLQDLIIAAVNEAMKKAQDLAQGEMSKLTGGIKIPGLFG
jgi:nucleoid-associated protein EbfC